MRAFLRVLAAFAVVMAIFFSTMFFLNYFSPFCPQGEVTELKAPFLKFGTGVAYVAGAPSLQDLSDSGTVPTRSRLLVCENSRALGPPHSLHTDIVAKGRGRFSHWNTAGFVFSASDNSDPNTNGRNYKAVVTR